MIIAFVDVGTIHVLPYSNQQHVVDATQTLNPTARHIDKEKVQNADESS
ncbi:MAG: hypothetical protein ACI90G_002649, partial [Urechidicola sp.]